jgi:membrane fusion protein (multidrug efflux system)
MPVEQEQQTSPRRAEPAGRMSEPSDAGSNAEGKRRTLLFAAILGALILVGAVSFWLYSRAYESTDDAQVDGHLNGITARIDGDVKAVHVEENQSVQAGEVLVELDPRDYEVAVEQAQAQVLRAQAGERAENPNLPITQTTTDAGLVTAAAGVADADAALAAAERDQLAAQARVQEVDANNARAQADLERFQALVSKGEVSRSAYDQVVASAKAYAASADSARASADAAQKVVEQRKAQLAQARSRMDSARSNAPHQVAISRANLQSKQAEVQAMQAALDRAQLDLSYCKIVAPVAGVISKRTVEPGEHVSKGQRLVTLSNLGDLWVTANFKESQVREMRAGQRVTISVDAFDKDFDGTIEAMPGSTGSVISLLPPENATGNYVKVVQRLPVRIRFKPGQDGLDRLRPGMSVVPKVWLK